jgi:hypothetical protein
MGGAGDMASTFAFAAAGTVVAIGGATFTGSAFAATFGATDATAAETWTCGFTVGVGTATTSFAVPAIRAASP